MSQASGGPPLERANSVAIPCTQNVAAAFGEDIADDSYSVSELSNYNDDKKSTKHDKHKEQHGSFTKAKLSLLKRMESVQQDPSMLGEDDDGESKRATSSGLSDRSDEASGPISTERDVFDHTARSFLSFAKTQFQMKILPTYSCSALPHPLLPKEDKAEYLASLASWLNVLLIMGDIQDSDSESTLIIAGTKTPVTTKVKSSFKMKYTKKDIDDAHRKYSEIFKDPINTDTSTVPFLSNSPETMLDRIQMLCAMGIYRPNLRDEIYCQICKQLTNNPSKNSTVRGWVLLALVVGCFTPSEKFAPILSSFLLEAPPGFAEKVDRQLRRTCGVGTRGHPPSWLEFQAAKNCKPLLIPVTFMSGRRVLCEMDAATTVFEIVKQICERLELLDYSGYSLYISLHTKISCLGHGGHRILDGISECEQRTKEMGLRENSSVWRLFLRREFFSPWHDPCANPIDADLVYQQVKRGVTMEEYKIDKEDVLISLASKVYYVEFHDDLGYYNLASCLGDFIPESQQEQKGKEYFQDIVRTAFEDSQLATQKPSKASIKADIAKFAMDNFYILFSRYYDVRKVVGPNLHIYDVVVGVNHRGIYVVDNTDILRLHVEFCEIVDVSKSKHHLTLGIANMDDFVFSTYQSDDFYGLATTFIEGLKKRSTVAIAKQDFTQLGGPSNPAIVKGDVLELSQTMQELAGSSSVTVLCTRTKKPYDVPVSLLYVIPAIEQPSEVMLERLSTQMCKNASAMITYESKEQHTLQQYAKTHFRQPNESTMIKFLSKASLKKKNVEILWTYSKDTLKKPLLKRTCNKEDIKTFACHCFSAIQSYMSNLVISDDMINYNMSSEWIFNPARRNKYLREEIYCQIIKQLTNNPDKASADRGWILLTLLTTITSPSSELQSQFLAFTKGSTQPLAKQCENNLNFKKNRGGCRLFAPHRLEHDMVMKHQHNVKIHIFLPNQTTQTLEVDSQTKIFDLKKEMASRLNLKTFHEYSLFLTSQDKVYCLPDKGYYFDCLSHSEMYWFRDRKNSNQDTISSVETPTPILVMMKKIWVNCQPGFDPVADEIFHFSQELPNFLQAYHQIPDALVPRLAALVYTAQFGRDEKQLTTFSEVAPLILPKDYLDGKAIVDVEKSVKAEFEKWKLAQPKVVKSAFLQELSRFQTYGSVFCEVRQRKIETLPKNCLMAVNYTGIHIVDAKSKAILKTFSFETIPNWAYDDNSFTIIVTEKKSTQKLLLETTVGQNMDDLLMSYVAWIMNFQMRKKDGNFDETFGESIC